MNNILAAGDTPVPENSDARMARIAFYMMIPPVCLFGIASTDSPPMLTSAPLAESQKDFATIAPKSHGPDVLPAALMGNPAGSNRAPANWGRFTACAKFVTPRLFGVAMSVVVDDCFNIGPAMLATRPTYRAYRRRARA